MRLAGFDAGAAGIFLGGTIHDVAQVVGAGYIISPEAGANATYVKLLRVAMLLPVVLALSLAFRAQRRQRQGHAHRAVVPAGVRGARRRGQRRLAAARPPSARCPTSRAPAW